ESCWFAVDQDGRVACFDRDQLGAAPMKRCWGPRPEPPAMPRQAQALTAEVAGHHASARSPARAYTFVTRADALGQELTRGAPQSATGRWAVLLHGDQAVISGGAGTTLGEPVPATFVQWLHSRGLCEGCARSSLRDSRVAGAFVYQHHGRARASPY